MPKLTKLNIWLYNLLNNYVYRIYDLYINKIVRKQIKEVKKIPIIIINFNQLFYLKQLVNFLVEREFGNIVIVDNKSTYPPLLQYYKEIQSKVKIEFMSENFGHLVFFENKELLKKYAKGFFVITDSDIVPNKNLPLDFLEQLLSHLIQHWKEITKVGFALRVDDIPKENQLKEKILHWEKEFWAVKKEEGVYIAPLDTTFALYKPGYPNKYNQVHCFSAHRFADDFTATHGGWYINQDFLTDEQQYYITTASASSSWLQDEKNVN